MTFFSEENNINKIAPSNTNDSSLNLNATSLISPILSSNSSILVNGNVQRLSTVDDQSVSYVATGTATSSRSSSSESSTINKEVDEVEKHISVQGIVPISSSKKEVSQKRKSRNPK